MVWEGVNKVYVKQARDGRNGGTDTLNSIQYLICNAFYTSAESQVQCCISHFHSIHVLYVSAGDSTWFPFESR